MAENRSKRVSEFIEPFRVEPGSKVTLAKDFDPAFKAGISKKREGVELLQHGIEMLSEYQERLAAQDTHGVLVVLQALDAAGQGRDDPARDEWREPAGRLRARVQGPVQRGARPRLPVAVREVAARARGDRDLQPLLLRGGARRPRPSGDPRPAEVAEGGEGKGHLEAALSRHQRLGALHHRQRLQGREDLPQPVEGAAADPFPAARRPSRPQLEVLGK